MIEENKTELKLDESNDLYFKISVFGAERPPESIRLVCESGDIAYVFKGKATNESGIVCFVVPPMKDSLRAGLYEARVEVIVDNHYFVPVKFEAEFKQPMKVVAESVATLQPNQTVKTTDIEIQARPVSRSQYASLREKYKKREKYKNTNAPSKK